MNENTFWKRVKFLLKERGINQQTVAKKCRFNYGTFRKWVASDVIPAAEESYRLARFLKVSLEYLLTGVQTDTAGRIEEIRALLKAANEKLEAIQYHPV